MTTPPTPHKPAWVQLYEARTQPQPETRSPGRPPAPVPRHKVGFTLSQGEVSEIAVWQDRLSGLLGRKISTGETIGILVRICSARLGTTYGQNTPESLLGLVEKMIGGE
jgi:hypothetical protein